MRIKEFFYILISLLLALDGVLLFLSSQLNTIFFYIGKGLIFFILTYLTLFYRKIVKPLNTIGSGMKLLREQGFNSRFSPVDQYETDRMMNIFNRMMRQLKNERLRLREQNNFLGLLIKTSPTGVTITSLDEDFSELNPMALRALDVRLESVQGKKMKKVDSSLVVELANLPKREEVAVRLNDPNIYRYTHSSLIDRGFQHPFCSVKTLTDEMMKAGEKVYERAIHMIAHEVNNTTAGITSILDTVEQALSSEEGMGDVRDMMRMCTDRCFSMSRLITCFAGVVKIPEPTLFSVNLNDLVFTCKQFMEGTCNNRRITLRVEIDKSLKDVMLDAALFGQVLVSIIKNAAESIEADEEITVHTLAPVTVEVIDSGQGISRETEAKLFGPFFSTEPNGQGTGLILTREVLMRHGYTFSLRTYADRLTRFRITFP